MKARLVPIYFDPGRDEGFDEQLARLGELLVDDAEFLPPVALGAALPAEADAVVFPQMLGEAYRRVADFRAIDVPILVVTSEFGTLNMWDWEIVAYLEGEGVSTFAPYTLAQTRMLCRASAVRRDLLPAGPILDLQVQVTREIDRRTRDARPRAAPLGPLDLLRRAAPVLAEGAQVGTLTLGGDRVQVDVALPDFRALDALIAGLAQAGIRAGTARSGIDAGGVAATLTLEEAP